MPAPASPRHFAAIALGANLGDRAATLHAAVHDLQALGDVRAVSSFYNTAPVGIVEQPRFINAAALLETILTPQDLLDQLLSIERKHGRDRHNAVVKGPRTLDLDLLLYDQLTLQTAELMLPHPEMHRRRFVLAPLAEIAPAMRHPELEQTIAELLAALPRE